MRLSEDAAVVKRRAHGYMKVSSILD